MAFDLPSLPYDMDALEPHIDAKTMEIHHGKHHQAYVDNANKALDGTEWADAPVEDVLRAIGDLPEDKQAAVRNNAGGHANHSLFWQVMSPEGGGEPSGALADAIGEAFAGVDGLKETMTQNGGPASAGSTPAVISVSVMIPMVFCASLVPWASETIDEETIWPSLNPLVTVPFAARAVIR